MEKIREDEEVNCGDRSNGFLIDRLAEFVRIEKNEKKMTTFIASANAVLSESSKR